MRLFAVVGLVAVLSLSFGVSVRAQEGAGGSSVLAVPVCGEVVVRSQDKRERDSGIYILFLGQSRPLARWQLNVDLTLPVLGMVLRGPAAIAMEEREKSLPYGAVEIYQIGEAKNVVLPGPAGDATISLMLGPSARWLSWDEPVRPPGTGLKVPIQIRGTGGTGMFDGIRIAGVLNGFDKPQGTLYLSFPSPDAAVKPVQAGLGQNSSLNDAQRAEALERAKQAIALAQVATFPTEAQLVAASQPVPAQTPPPRAYATATIQRSVGQALVTLQIAVGAGIEHQTVKVVVVGSDGAVKTAYESAYDPGERVSASVCQTPPFIVLVYVAGAMVKQITVPAQ